MILTNIVQYHLKLPNIIKYCLILSNIAQYYQILSSISVHFCLSCNILQLIHLKSDLDAVKTKKNQSGY